MEGNRTALEVALDAGAVLDPAQEAGEAKPALFEAFENDFLMGPAKKIL